MRDRSPGSGVRVPDRAPAAGASGGRSNPEPRTPDPGAGGGRLYVVATPIGNLGDLSTRAIALLGEVSLVLAEDTRQVRKLLTHFAIKTPARALHEHNEAREVPALLALLTTGKDLALVSDAGTPLVSDPGYRLVRAARDAGVPVLAVPGPSAVTAAVAVAGLPPVPLTFAGFLPAKRGARDQALAALATLPHTLVLFLSPHRLAAELASCAGQLGPAREAALLAELTKLHERCVRGTLEELATRATTAPARGEYTLVVGPPAVAPPNVTPTPADARATLDRALARGLALPEARRAAARELGISRSDLYTLLTPQRPR
jgi:16S rRNA (cytidine1402-2'-O)-methyltransferase